MFVTPQALRVGSYQPPVLKTVVPPLVPPHTIMRSPAHTAVC